MLHTFYIERSEQGFSDWGLGSPKGPKRVQIKEKNNIFALNVPLHYSKPYCKIETVKSVIFIERSAIQVILN